MHSRDPSPFTPPARATTLPTPSIIPPTTTAKHHHHHHRLHHPHHRHHHRGPTRAVTQPQSGSGASGVSTADSDSLARVMTGEESAGRGGGGKHEKERKTWAVLREKKVERGLGDNYLRLRLHSLTTLSTTTTRRLDYTYYSLLSHASTISTLLSSLCTLSTTTPPTLSLSTHQAQLANLEKTIHSRQDQVKELQARLASSRAKVEKLGDRLENVRVWVEGVERGEREWGGKVRMRLRALAGVAVGVLVLLVLLQGWRICVFRGGDGRLGRHGDLFAGRVGGGSSGGGGGGGGGDVMRKRWNNMNLGATERAAMMAQEKNVGGSGGIQSVLLTPKGVRRPKDNAGTGGRMRKRWNDMNLGAAERLAISSRDKLGSSRSTSSSSSSSSSTHSVPLTPSAVKWQGARGSDEKKDEDEDEDPRLRIFDEL